MAITAAERRDAIEAIVRHMEDAIAVAMDEARDALDRIGVPDGPIEPADRAALEGGQPVTDPEREALEQRFDASMEKVPNASPFDPTPFGEQFLKTLVTCAVATVPEDQAVTVYEACEAGMIDKLAADVRAAVVRRVQAILPPATV